MVKHGVKIKPRNRHVESKETRNILSLLYVTKNDILQELGRTEVLEDYGSLMLQLRDVERDIGLAKDVLKGELRKGV